MKPHKHAELIKAWADGVEIQRRIIRNGENIDEPIISYSWLTENIPMWSIHEEYRIKPEPKPDVEMLFQVQNLHETDWLPNVKWITKTITPNLKLIWDAETFEFKSAEVLK